MIRYKCPNCEELLEAPATLVGEDLVCPRCSGRTIVPKRIATSATEAGRNRYWSPAGIAVPMLVSAIGNIVIGIFWAATCFGIVIAVPLFILSGIEFAHYGRAGTIPPGRYAERVTTTGVWQIILGLFNTITLVCGIIILVNASKVKREAHRQRYGRLMP